MVLYVSLGFITFSSLGEAAGILLSSTICETHGFTYALEILSTILALLSASYFLICGNCKMCSCTGETAEEYANKYEETNYSET